MAKNANNEPSTGCRHFIEAMASTCVRGLVVGGKQLQLVSMKTNLYPFEGHALYRVSDGLAEAINDHVGAPIVTRSVVVDSVRDGILGKDGVRRVLPHLKMGKALWSSVEVYLAFARECARADERVVASR